MGTRLKTLLVGAVAAAFCATVASQAPSPVSLKRFPEPVKQTLDGLPAYCVALSASSRVCDVDDGTGDGLQVRLITGGVATVLSNDRMPVYHGMIGAMSTDLDEDGKAELVVVDHTGTTNGMAMTHDRIFVIENAEQPNRSWISFEVAEYGNGAGTFVRRADRSGTWILSTEWETSATLDPQRGYGTYLVGRWFKYAKGRLVSERGVIVRRLLNSFAEGRARGEEGQPHSYFLNGQGRSVNRDPGLASGDVISTVRGTVTRVAPITSDDASLQLTLSDGRRTYATFSIPYGDNPGEHIDHIGSTSLNRILPMGVAPAALGMDLTGRSVRIVRYKDGKTAVKVVLWID